FFLLFPKQHHHKHKACIITISSAIILVCVLSCNCSVKEFGFFEYGLVNDFLSEWCEMKTKLNNGEISPNEYFEWKITWPHA
ncbi:hypothetical protein ACQRCQ_14045, partial [Lachnospiraceae bacterium SGI.085]